LKKSIALVTLAAALIAFGFMVHPVQAATVGGAVLNADGNGIPGALVTIQQLNVVRGQRPYAARIAAGRGGIFVFKDIPAGRYVVTGLTRQGGARAQVAIRQDGAARVRLVIQGRREGQIARNGGDYRE